MPVAEDRAFTQPVLDPDLAEMLRDDELAMRVRRSLRLAMRNLSSALLATVERRVAVTHVRDNNNCAGEEARSAGSREAALARVRDIGHVTAGIVDQLSPGILGLIENLQLAQRKLGELEKRVGGSAAFSMLGVRQLLLAAERNSDRIQGVLHGVALFSELAMRSTRARRRILVAHDEPFLTGLLRSALEEDHDVQLARSGSEAQRALGVDSFDAFVCQLALPEIDGMELHQTLMTARPEQAGRMVFVTAGRAFGERERAFFSRHRPLQLRAPFSASQVRELIEALWRASP